MASARAARHPRPLRRRRTGKRMNRKGRKVAETGEKGSDGILHRRRRRERRDGAGKTSSRLRSFRSGEGPCPPCHPEEANPPLPVIPTKEAKPPLPVILRRRNRRRIRARATNPEACVIQETFPPNFVFYTISISILPIRRPANLDHPENEVHQSSSWFSAERRETIPSTWNASAPSRVVRPGRSVRLRTRWEGWR